MPLSEWLFLLYGFGLFYLLLHLGKVSDRGSFRYSWFFYVGAIFFGAFAGTGQATTAVDAEPSTVGAVFRVVSWLLMVVSAVFLYFSIDPLFPEKEQSEEA